MFYKVDLSPQSLIRAYSQGIFPMADETGRVRWYEANPRGILPFEKFHIPHDLKRILKQNKFKVTLDKAFGEVIRGCSRRSETTWISEEIIKAYIRFHELGYAHSVEAWLDGELAGGLYGVALGGAFFGESMFYRKRDASKVALCHLVKWLMASRFVLLDIQMLTDLLRRFGGILISKDEYLQRLQHAMSLERKLNSYEINWRKELSSQE
ncbi:MAG: leucyl/phenylalanyl-tRNA--protein transferase [Calditrichaeota bacterium]|nr:MAG: leucyl/phenylalanyl-tRNA--protein transferase [Calditrichota bacterium]